MALSDVNFPLNQNQSIDIYFDDLPTNLHLYWMSQPATLTPEAISQGEAPLADLRWRRYLDSDQSYQRERR